MRKVGTYLINLIGEIECLNYFCPGVLRGRGRISEIFVEILEIDPYILEIAVRCPNCRNLISNFRVEGYSWDGDMAPQLNWEKAISRVRQLWEMLQTDDKVILKASDLKWEEKRKWKRLKV